VAKTYPAIGPFAPGDILTAATMTSIDTNLDNQRVPPAVRVVRTSDVTNYSGSTITWQAETFDTDGMWSSGTTVTIQTAGIYLVNFYASANPVAGTPVYGNPQISINGTLQYIQQTPYFAGNSAMRGAITALHSFAASDTVTAAMDVNWGGAANGTLKGGTNFDSTRLALTWVGQAS
jgi:hypothetical protein